MAIELRILGPVEAVDGGRDVRLGGTHGRAVLALLVLGSGEVVPASRLVDEIWGDDPPASALNILQGHVSALRKELGRDLIETREPGYRLRAGHDTVDLRHFERLAADGTEALGRDQPAAAAALLRDALALWRGPALADLAAEGIARPAAARLDELRLLVRERRLEAELRCGRHAEVVAEAHALASEHPLREGAWSVLMLALYRCGRQADALAAFRAARSTLVDELGIEPGGALRELERAILRQDPSLTLAPPDASRPDPLPARHRAILAAGLDDGALPGLLALAEPLAAGGEVVIATTVAAAGDLGAVAGRVRGLAASMQARGTTARAAVFTSLAPGADLARLATEQDVDLVLVDAPSGVLEDARLLALLELASCDVAVMVDGPARSGPIVVPFTGADSDWSAIELGAWLARATASPLRLAGAATGASGRDASRLLASASLAVQRTLGVTAEPVLVEPDAEALVEAARDAAVVVVGLTDRWRREGVGRVRTALAASRQRPTLLVRRGLRPGGLAPRGSETRFTWTLGAGLG